MAHARTPTTALSPTTAHASRSAWRRHLLPAVLGVLVSSAAVNGLPHLLQGLAGNVFQTPFGAESSAAVNLAWGAANLLLAVGLAVTARRHIRATACAVGAAAGALGTAASLLVVLA